MEQTTKRPPTSDPPKIADWLVLRDGEDPQAFEARIAQELARRAKAPDFVSTIVGDEIERSLQIAMDAYGRAQLAAFAADRALEVKTAAFHHDASPSMRSAIDAKDGANAGLQAASAQRDAVLQARRTFESMKRSGALD
jgi:hypothetical protein